MMDEDIGLESLGDDDALGLEPDMSGAVEHLVQLQQRSQEQLTQVVLHINEVQAQVGQALSQALLQVAQSNEAIAQALARLSGPRRRIAVRDAEDRITHADDIPI